MHLFTEDLICDEALERTSGSGAGAGLRTNNNDDDDMRIRRDLIQREIDEEWSTPLAKISKLYYDHESWTFAREILEVPSAACRKIGDEARSLASRHIIDRLREKQYLDKIHTVAPRLRSAVELLSKPDADYVFPPFQFVVNQLRRKYPEVYESVVQKVHLRIPNDMRPKMMFVSMAKYVVENEAGEIVMNWGKFTALLALAGALAIDSVEAGFPEGVTEVVDIFGVLTEQVLGEWILNEGGGWEGFIRLNQYQPMLPPIPRTMIILFLLIGLIYIVSRLVLSIVLHFWLYEDLEEIYWGKWGNIYPYAYCQSETNQVCFGAKNLLQYLLEERSA